VKPWDTGVVIKVWSPFPMVRVQTARPASLIQGTT